MEPLRVGDRFPGLQAPVLDGGTLRIPDELHDVVAVLLFYRGHW
jgi:peroxiredoxin